MSPYILLYLTLGSMWFSIFFAPLSGAYYRLPNRDRLEIISGFISFLGLGFAFGILIS